MWFSSSRTKPRMHAFVSESINKIIGILSWRNKYETAKKEAVE
jgi:hypothetical protein